MSKKLVVDFEWSFLLIWLENALSQNENKDERFPEEAEGKRWLKMEKKKNDAILFDVW